MTKFDYWELPDDLEVLEQIRKCAVLGSIEVKPEYQSRGVASKLILHAEELAKQKGYTKVGLSVAVETTRARRLYENLGFADRNIEEYLETRT